MKKLNLKKFHLLKKNIKKELNMSEKKYTEDHEWVQIDGDIVTVGITNHAQESLGDIVFVDLPAVGKEVKAKDELCVIESVKAASDIYSPLDGEVTEINDNLTNDSSLVNQDAETKGWIFKMKVSNLEQYNSLMSLDQYLEFLEK
jgi:glycine cleavage system H protein